MSPAATPRYLDWRIWAASTVVFGTLTVFVAVASPAALTGLDPTPTPAEPPADATQTPTTTGTEPATRTPQPTSTTVPETPVSTTDVTRTPSETADETPTSTPMATDSPDTHSTATRRRANDTRSPYIGGPPAETETPTETAAETAAETVANEAEPATQTESMTPSSTPPPTTVAPPETATEQADAAPVTPSEATTSPVPDAFANRSIDLVTVITVLSGLFTIFPGLSSAMTFVLQRRRAVDTGQATLDDFVR